MVMVLQVRPVLSRYRCPALDQGETGQSGYWMKVIGYQHFETNNQ